MSGTHRKVDVELPGKVNSNSHGARPVRLIISMIKWTSKLSIKNSLTGTLSQNAWKADTSRSMAEPEWGSIIHIGRDQYKLLDTPVLI